MFNAFKPLLLTLAVFAALKGYFVLVRGGSVLVGLLRFKLCRFLCGDLMSDKNS